MNLSKLFKALLALTCSALVLASSSSSAAGADAGAAVPKAAEAKSASPRTVEIKVTQNGYEPSPIKLKKGEPVKLVVTRTTEQTSATEIVVDKTDINVPLPLNKPVEIAFTPKESGKLVYGCHMGKMISGVFMVE